MYLLTYLPTISSSLALQGGWQQYIELNPLQIFKAALKYLQCLIRWCIKRSQIVYLLLTGRGEGRRREGGIEVSHSSAHHFHWMPSNLRIWREQEKVLFVNSLYLFHNFTNLLSTPSPFSFLSTYGGLLGLLGQQPCHAPPPNCS